MIFFDNISHIQNSFGEIMNNIIKLSLISIMTVSVMAEELEIEEKLRNRGHSAQEVIQNAITNEPKEVADARSFRQMFTDGKVTGQIELVYSSHHAKNDDNPYATAIGGHLLYELAEYNGFNAGVEFSTAHNIDGITGDGDKENTNLASSDGSYTELTQAFLNYKYADLNVRVGRQLIDTPLADSDDIRIINNTFEAAIATYELGDFSFMAGYLSRWQGTDTGLDTDNEWQDTGDDGTYLGSVAYACDLFDVSAWYYDISEAEHDNTATGNVANRSTYLDVSFHNQITKDIFIHSSAQYLNQEEKDNSGIKSNIYGLMFEVVFFEDLSFSAAYNNSEKKSGRQSFSGFGGGTLYTNMDNMIIDNITADRDASSIVAGINYSIGEFNFLYAYGDFDGDKDSTGQKEHIVEQNIGTSYHATENLTFGLLCVINNDKEDTGSGAYFNNGDFENYRAVVAYSF